MRTSSPLRDCLAPGIRVLFVGINPGMRSADTGHHFAGYSNRFWKLLFDAGLVPERLTFEDDRRLSEFGYGMTNLVARATPGIGDLGPAEYEAGRRRLIAKIRRYRPDVVVLIGVTLYRALQRRGAARPTHASPSQNGTRVANRGVGRVSRESGRLPEPLGLREERLAGAPIFVLPNPSGRNANYSYVEMLQAFKALRRHLDEHPHDPSSTAA